MSITLVTLKKAVRENALYKGSVRTAKRLKWTIGKKSAGRISTMTDEEALEILNEVHPCPVNTFRPSPFKTREKELSIIIPVYNGEEYVGQCLDSVLSNLEHFSKTSEIIVINDGSKDGTGKVLEEYEKKDSRIVVMTCVNQGQAHARNLGIHAAVGEYLMFLDADDYITENTISILYDKIKSEDADIAFCNYITFSGEHRYPEPEIREAVLTSHEKMLELPGFLWGRICHYSLFEGIGFPEHMRHDDTLVHWVMFRRCRKLAIANHYGYMYRMNPGGISYSATKKRRSLDTLWVLGEILKMRKEAGIEMIEADTIEFLRHVTLHSYFRIRSLEEKQIEAYFVHAMELLKEYEFLPVTDGKYRELYGWFIERNVGMLKLYCETLENL